MKYCPKKMMYIISLFFTFSLFAQENYGRILFSHGDNIKWIDDQKVSIQELSRVSKGDMLETLKDSVLWVYLKDGLLVRLAPMTKVEFREIVVSSKSTFYFIRLIDGFVNVIDYRTQSKTSGPETDKLFSWNGVKSDTQMHDKELKVLVVARNFSLLTSNPDLLAFSPLQGESHLQIRQGDHSKLQLRIKEKKELIEVGELQTWFSVTMLGDSYQKIESKEIELLSLMELWTRRIDPIKAKALFYYSKYNLALDATEMNDTAIVDLHIRYLLAHSLIYENMNQDVLSKTKIEATKEIEYYRLSRKKYFDHVFY